MRGLFITGTDTNVGKTHIACMLADALVKNGLNVIPRKPVESGCLRKNNILQPADAMQLLLASQSKDDLQKVCPYRFADAISPAQAAKLANQPVFLHELVNACSVESCSDNDFLLVEGAGGFYSPLCEDALNSDLAEKLQHPLLVVADNKLGCINHILLTLEAASRRNIKIKSIILNNTEPHLYNNLYNYEELVRLLDIPVILVNYKDRHFNKDGITKLKSIGLL